MLHVMNLSLYEDTGRHLVRGHGSCKTKLRIPIYFLLPYQSSHSKYTTLLKSIAELQELYILTNSGIKAGKQRFRKEAKQLELSIWNYWYISNEPTRPLICKF